MIIERFILPYSVFVEEEIVEALKKIGNNKKSIVFALSQSGELEGVMTDGDFRRWIIDQPDIDVSQPVSTVISRDFVSVRNGASVSEIEKLLVGKIKIVPIIDEFNRLVSVALPSKPELHIGSFAIEPDSSTFIIAEIGNNHNGSLDSAKKLIDEAKASGADCAKFQMRQMSALYSNNGDASYISEDLGAQYVLDILSRFSLSNKDLFSAFDYCKEQGIFPLCTPWDEESLTLLEKYGMEAYKVASADLTNMGMLEKITLTHKPIILSTGMSTEAEICQTIDFLNHRGASFVLLHCNSTYPAPFKDIQLKYMERLRELGNCPVGYSGHERGISVPLAAVALGAKVIEKHLTLNKNLEGNDHKVSLVPSEFKEMVVNIRRIEESLGDQGPRSVTQGEMMNREILAKSLVVSETISVGELISSNKVEIRSPGKGLQPNRFLDLVGRKATRDMKPGDFFFASDLEDSVAEAQPTYNFGRPWGIPVRFHDFKALTKKTKPDLAEFHLSYKDMDEKLENHFDDFCPMDFVIHCPELFAGDHLLDLCSEDEDYRHRSIFEMQRVIDLTRKINAYFPNTKRPLIVTNVGGFTLDHHIGKDEIGRFYEILVNSLSELDWEGVEIIPQTMPPYPWHFGGQRYHNLFVDMDGIAAFCAAQNMRICLDVSHSALACNFAHDSFSEFMTKVAPYAAHLHIADAKGVDGEGLQIGNGEIDFLAFAKAINQHAPDAGFIPEIWQGHKNGGDGFWRALNELEKWLAHS